MLKMGLFFAFLLVAIMSLSGLYVFGAKVFKAHLSDGWYPRDKQALVRAMDKLEKSAQQKYNATVDSATIRAIIVPHAGYAYSGDVAAAAYRLVQPKLENPGDGKTLELLRQQRKIHKVIILAPSHYAFFTGIALPAFDTYEIPLGVLTVDKNIVQALLPHKLFQVQDRESIFAKEHAVEVQLPFIYTYIGNNGANPFSIVPLIVGSLSLDQLREAADILSQYIDEHTLVIVSSDFTHYGTRFNYTPFSDYQLLRIRQLDSGALYYIENYDLEGFLSYVARTDATICGRTPIALLLALLERKVWGSDKASDGIESRLIAYKSSQEVKGGDSNGESGSNNADFESVSYASLVFSKQQRSDLGLGKFRHDSSTSGDQYTAYEKRDLLRYARATLEQLYKPTIAPELLLPILTKSNQKKGGVFVTIYTKQDQLLDKSPVRDKSQNKSLGKLRGCIGRITSSEPVYKTVAAMTRAAALEDSRFSPVTKDELADIILSLSLLTEPKPIKSYTDIELGTQGIILNNGSKQAVFLPKVATEFGWDLPKTLTELSKKAGLSADAWQKEGTHFQVFESIDFSEID